MLGWGADGLGNILFRALLEGAEAVEA